MTTRDASRPHLLLLHAFPLHSGMWAPQQDAISTRAEIMAPDLPGFGRAPGLDDESFTMDRIARYLQGELEAKGIERVVLAGLSMGGYIAFECWRLFPEKIAGMILADTKATADTEEGRKGRYASAEQIGRGEFDAFVAGLLVKLLSPVTREHRPELVDQVRSMMRDSSPASAIAAQIGMAVRADSTDLLSKITVPVALIFGEDDAITTIDEGKRMAEAIPDATLTIVPKAGHLANLENPETFNAAMTGLLDRIAQ